MITSLIIGFFGASSLASIIVFAACAASARADEFQREAFARFYDEAEQFPTDKRRPVTSTNQLALNP